VAVDGTDLRTLRPAEADRFRLTRVGFVWQSTARNLIPYLDAAGNVGLPLRLSRRSDPEGRSERLLELVGLGDRMRHKPAQLSGGQQQRVAIAVALANSPPLLLADEPTGELDGETAKEIYGLLRTVNRDLGLTVVIVSHDPNMAAVVDRVVELRDGQTAMEHHAGRDRSDQRVVLLVDTLGRIRMPDRFRDDLGIGERVEASVVDGRIVLSPFDLEQRRTEWTDGTDGD
jgi:ABC-type lipoprotein export system ATPase subunit